MRSTIASRHGDRVSIALILSYVFDWIVITIGLLIGIFFGNRTPNKRPFSLSNDDIAFPFKVHETVSSKVLFAVSVAAPAGIILLLALILVPGPTVPKSIPKALVWRRKLWEWFAGWTGLALSSVTAWVMTNGMKNLFGHWRPDLLSRCNPDIANIAKFAVGGFPNTSDGSFLVTWEICQTTDQSNLDDGFRSFPSGHASASAAGLVYLSLFLAAKFAVRVPYLAPRIYGRESSYFSAFPSRTNGRSYDSQNLKPTADQYHKDNLAEMQFDRLLSSSEDSAVAARNRSAAPPLYLLVAVVVPFFTAIYITSTRYSDFRHHGFDLLFGFTLGTLTAISSFCFYQLPISRGAGWAWGPRSRDHAFWAGIGIGSYANTDLKSSSVVPGQDESNGGLEAANAARVVGPDVSGDDSRVV